MTRVNDERRSMDILCNSEKHATPSLEKCHHGAKIRLTLYIFILKEDYYPMNALLTTLDTNAKFYLPLVQKSNVTTPLPSPIFILCIDNQLELPAPGTRPSTKSTFTISRHGYSIFDSPYDHGRWRMELRGGSW